MRFSDLSCKEVINVNDCRCLGNVSDLDIDMECGKICALIVPGPGKYLGIFGKEYEFWIPWVKIVKIGPDIIIADVKENEMRHRV